MTEFNLNPQANALANRALTGAPPANAGQPPVAAPTRAPGVPGDQYQANPAAAPRTPQGDAYFAVYAMSLGEPDPIKVSQALQGLDSLGPAYREQAIGAVRSQLVVGQAPMRSLVLLDALQRWGDMTSLNQIRPMMHDPDPEVASTASRVFAQGAAVQARTQGPGPANAPGQAPGAPPAMAVEAQNALTKSYIDRLKDYRTAPGVAVEIAQLPMNQLAPILTGLANDRTFEDSFANDKIFDLLTKAVAARVREPGAVDALRAVLNRPGAPQSREMGTAKVRAAIATIHYGTPQDQAGFLRVMATDMFVTKEQVAVLIRTLKSRPDLMRERATIVTLGAISNQPYSSVAVTAAMDALAATNTPLAWDAIAQSNFWRGTHGPATTHQILQIIKDKAPRPLPPKLVEQLRYLQTAPGRTEKPGQDMIRDLLK